MNQGEQRLNRCHKCTDRLAVQRLCDQYEARSVSRFGRFYTTSWLLNATCVATTPRSSAHDKADLSHSNRNIKGGNTARLPLRSQTSSPNYRRRYPDIFSFIACRGSMPHEFLDPKSSKVLTRRVLWKLDVHILPALVLVRCHVFFTGKCMSLTSVTSSGLPAI